MAILWLEAIVSYGIGATLVGKYGTSAGFTLYIAAFTLSSNAIGVVTEEWKGSSSTACKLLAAGIAIVLASVVLLNLGGAFTKQAEDDCAGIWQA